MQLKELKPRPGLEENEKLARRYTQFRELVAALAARPLPEEGRQLEVELKY